MQEEQIEEIEHMRLALYALASDIIKKTYVFKMTYGASPTTVILNTSFEKYVGSKIAGLNVLCSKKVIEPEVF